VRKLPSGTGNSVVRQAELMVSGSGGLRATFGHVVRPIREEEDVVLRARRRTRNRPRARAEHGRKGAECAGFVRKGRVDLGGGIEGIREDEL
jgi:hypothetical protein